MNLTNVKYGWLLFKFKDHGIEVEGNNILRVTSGELESLIDKAYSFIHKAKVDMWKQRDTELAKIEAAKAEAEVVQKQQMEFDLSE